MNFRRNVKKIFLAGALFCSATPAFAQPKPVLIQSGTANEVASFEDVLESFTEDAYFKRIDASIHVIRVKDGQQMFSHDAEQARIPASTMKVLTTASALKALGPAYRFGTELFIDGDIDAAGVLQGNLYVKGYADPTLVVEKLWKLVQELKLEGMKSINGDVVFDDTFLDNKYQLQGWDKQEDIERGPAYFATNSALSLNFNTVALMIGPGGEVGGQGRALLETPADGYVEVLNRTVTGAVGSRRWLDIQREVTPKGMKFKVEGVLPKGTDTLRIYRTVADPTAHFMAAWQGLEKTHGLRVKGKHRKGTVPENATLFHRKQSPPLASILMDMNKYSNNFIAEQVMKTVGAEKFGAPGTVDKGVRWTRSYLQSLGLTSEDFTLVNGSGLSQQSFLKPKVLTAVLKGMSEDRFVGSEFRTSLAIAGVDGTLWKRLKNDAGRMRGKTGTINGVHCLSGYFHSDDGTEYAYAFLMNGLRGRISRAKKLQDQMLKTMMRSVGAMAKNAENKPNKEN